MVWRCQAGWLLRVKLCRVNKFSSLNRSLGKLGDRFTSYASWDGGSTDCSMAKVQVLPWVITCRLSTLSDAHTVKQTLDPKSHTANKEIKMMKKKPLSTTQRTHQMEKTSSGSQAPMWSNNFGKHLRLYGPAASAGPSGSRMIQQLEQAPHALVWSSSFRKHGSVESTASAIPLGLVESNSFS